MAVRQNGQSSTPNILRIRAEADAAHGTGNADPPADMVGLMRI